MPLDYPRPAPVDVSAPKTAPRRTIKPRRWTDNAIEQALGPLIAHTGRWPTALEFQAAGLDGLRFVLYDRGDVERWAAHFGVNPRPQGDHRGRPLLWRDEEIEKALARIIAPTGRWPKKQQFREAGLEGLYSTLIQRGEIYRWAEHFGLRSRSGNPKVWTEAAIARVLGPLITRTGGHWPTALEFRAAGFSGLLDALNRRGEVERWAAHFEVSARRQIPGRPRLWTDAAITEAITPLVEELGRWPTRTQFGLAGLEGLRRTLDRRGDLARWREHFGFRATSARTYTDEHLEDELRSFLGDRPDWPRQAEFLEAGLHTLLQRIYHRGGSEYWARRLAVRARPTSGGRHKYWTHRRIERTLRELVGDTGCFPPGSAFREAGVGGLLSVIHAGDGTAYWAAYLGLPAPSRGGRRQAAA